eukprot:NODE_4332_length_1904_cov_13.483962.p1 GENE.NODE_4332_length_1904_cov_13.483962~~NODE_4332_length_1904_cov_13.483962.p1  ORF type:complete len:392 (+),score=149.19 NODE_4332_length_1904_cov_13.483962:80-1177(+)
MDGAQAVLAPVPHKRKRTEEEEKAKHEAKRARKGGGTDDDEEEKPGISRRAKKRGPRTPQEHAEKRDRDAHLLYLGNLPLSWTKHEVKKLIRKALGEYTGPFGPIWFRSEPVAEEYERGLRSRGHIFKAYREGAADSKDAYVKFPTPELAMIARKGASNVVADSTHLVRADGVGESALLARLDPKRTIFVGNLQADITEHHLRTVFAKAGDINVVRIVRDKYTKECKGIAFVRFSERSSVKAALKASLNPGIEFRGRWLRVTNVEKQAERADLHPAVQRMRGRWQAKQMRADRQEKAYAKAAKGITKKEDRTKKTPKITKAKPELKKSKGKRGGTRRGSGGKVRAKAKKGKAARTARNKRPRSKK